MKKHTYFAVAVLCLSTCIVLAREVNRAEPESHHTAAVEGGISVYFSPKGGCTEAIIEQLDSAKKTIDLQAYYFAATDIAKAMADAQKRGVKFRAVLDKKASGTQYSGATHLFNHGVSTFVDGEHEQSAMPILHLKL